LGLVGACGIHAVVSSRIAASSGFNSSSVLLYLETG
jgi:hypothetical protein